MFIINFLYSEGMGWSQARAKWRARKCAEIHTRSGPDHKKFSETGGGYEQRVS